MAGSRHLNAFKCSLQNRNPLALRSAVGDEFLPGPGFSIPVQSSLAVISGSDTSWYLCFLDSLQCLANCAVPSCGKRNAIVGMCISSLKEIIAFSVLGHGS